MSYISAGVEEGAAILLFSGVGGGFEDTELFTDKRTNAMDAQATLKIIQKFSSCSKAFA